MKSEPASYLVRLASDKSRQLVDPANTLKGALAIVKVDTANLESGDEGSDPPVQVVVDKHGEILLQTRGTRTPMTEDQLLALVDQILSTIRADPARVLTEQNSSVSGGVR